MPNTIFTSDVQALKSLQDNKFEYTEPKDGRFRTADFNRKQEFLNGYAKIAAFLCDKARFEKALKEVSRQLWDVYRKFPATTRNKFTRALNVVAAAKRFNFQERFSVNTAYYVENKNPIGIKLIGGDPQLGYMLRNRLFWKDSMDLRHGEHSHSLQWLAIAQGLSNLVPSAGELYEKTGNFRAQSRNDQPGQRSMLMWQWLADCFPTDLNNLAGATFLNGETLESNCYRSPQLISDYLWKRGWPLPGHFVSTYLFYRYKNRGWLTTTEVWNPKGFTESRLVQIYDGQANAPKRGGLGAPSWTPSARVATRMLRDTNNYVPAHNAAKQPKAQYTLQLHGEMGTLCYF